MTKIQINSDLIHALLDLMQRRRELQRGTPAARECRYQKHVRFSALRGLLGAPATPWYSSGIAGPLTVCTLG